MRVTNERELKLMAPDEFDSIEGLGEPIEDRVFTSTYGKKVPVSRDSCAAARS